jgi:tetratricopeptide (TPR) repeat protein
LRVNNVILASALLLGIVVNAKAQNEDALIRSGNRAYRQKQIEQSKQDYKKALDKAPENPVANYNMGNSEFRGNEFGDAEKSYEASISHSAEKSMTEKGYYNMGVAQIKQKQLEQSIDSWKTALKLDPNDQEARENLQKALLELKMKQPPPPPKENQKDKEKEKKDQNKNEQPKPQQSKLTKQQVDQLLRALEQKEKDVQDKMNQSKVKSLSQPEKDW